MCKKHHKELRDNRAIMVNPNEAVVVARFNTNDDRDPDRRRDAHDHITWEGSTAPGCTSG